MNDWKRAITLANCYFICLTLVPSALADYVGVTIVTKDDPDTEFLCTQGNGDFVPGPLTVCNVYAAFDDPNNVLLSVGNADLQVFNGAETDVFFQHPINFTPLAPDCAFIPIFPDLICDSFVTIGLKCSDVYYGTTTDGDFHYSAFQFNGHILGGWHTTNPFKGQGDAGEYPDLQVLFLQSSVFLGRNLSGDIDIFWSESYPEGDIFAEVDVPIDCAAQCPEGQECDDSDACTEEDQCNSGICTGSPIDCDDRNPCTDDLCDPISGCSSSPNNNPADDGDACTVNDMCVDGAPSGIPVECPEGQACDPATGECVEEQDPCECVNGKVTLCHVPPGNLSNARTIRVGCAARDKHLAHGDICGPCE